MFHHPVVVIFFFQAEDGIRGTSVTGVQTCALPISAATGCALTATIRRACASASSRVISPSSLPSVAAHAALEVASASNPSPAMTLAEPPSQTLGTTKMPGVSCSARKRIALSRWLGITLTPRRAPLAVPAPRYTLAQSPTRKPARDPPHRSRSRPRCGRGRRSEHGRGRRSGRSAFAGLVAVIASVRTRAPQTPLSTSEPFHVYYPES